MTTTTNVGEIIESEIPEMANFLARQVRADEPTMANPLSAVDRLRWLLLQNPERAAQIPFGWRIRGKEGVVVGAAICTPFHIGAGMFRATALMFSKFFVDLPYRGMGIDLLMQFVMLGETYPLFVTSTNAIAGRIFAGLGAMKIDGLDHALLAVNRMSPLAEEFFHRRLKQPFLARLLASPTWIAQRPLPWVAAGRLIALQNADEIVALNLPDTGDRLAVIRDRDYVNWRYFSGDGEKPVYRFCLPGESDRLVVVNLLQSGYRRQIRVLNVLDVWPPTTPGAAQSLVASLQLHYRGKFDALWLRSQSTDVEDSLRAGGMKRHDFPAPLGWFIDSNNRLPTHQWYIMPGESE